MKKNYETADQYINYYKNAKKYFGVDLDAKGIETFKKLAECLSLLPDDDKMAADIFFAFLINSVKLYSKRFNREYFINTVDHIYLQENKE